MAAYCRIFEHLIEERVSEEIARTKEHLINRHTLHAVNRAYEITLRCYTAVLGGRQHDAKLEKLIPRLWQQAGTRMRRYDAKLAEKLKATNGFWSKKVTWENETIQEVWPHLNAIRVCTNRMDTTLRNLLGVLSRRKNPGCSCNTIFRK